MIRRYFKYVTEYVAGQAVKGWSNYLTPGNVLSGDGCNGCVCRGNSGAGETSLGETADIVITANSPGEVATWLVPVVRALHDRIPWGRVTVFIPPCPFASGAEVDVVSRVQGVSAVYGPGEFIRFAFLGRSLPRFRPADNGVVLFLGGDLYHAARLARILGFPAIAYTEGRVAWKKSFRCFLVPDSEALKRATRKGVDGTQVKVVGDLMLDAVCPRFSPSEMREFLNVNGRPVVSLFPGSRPYEFRYVLPFFLRVAEILKPELPDVVFTVSLSPFVGEKELREAGRYTSPRIEGAAASVGALSLPCPDARSWVLRTGTGLTVMAVKGMQYDLMGISELAVTIPGSNTAEMAGAGLPMVVAIPLNILEKIPLTGLAGSVDRIPLIGKPLKRIAVSRFAGRVVFAALPNARAGRYIVPEIRGVLKPEDVASPLVELMRRPGRRQRMSAELKQVMGPPGAANVAEEIQALLEKEGK